MAISITHAFVSGKADPPDASLIKPSNWNAGHVLTLGTGKLVGRTTAATGAAEEIAVAGALTFTAQTLSLPVNAVGNTYLADMATQTIKGRTTAATGDPEDLTVTQVTAMLNQFTTSLKGLVPASGGGTTNFLRADGSWAAPPTANAQLLLDSIASTRGYTLYRGSGGWAGLAPNTAGFVLRDGGSGADPSWVGGITRLNSGTVSSAATLDIALTSGYSKYILILDDVVPATGGSAFNLRVSVDSGSTYRSTAGDYRYSALYSTGPSGAAPALYNQAGLGDTAIILGAASSNMVNTTNQPQSYVLQIYPGTASKRNTIIFKSIQTYDASGPGTPTIASNDGGASYVGTAAALTNVRFLFGSGNISTCTWSIYGVT